VNDLVRPSSLFAPGVAASATSGVLATVPNPPPEAARLATGTTLRGVVVGEDGKGQTLIKTELGTLAIATKAHLAPDSEVILQIRSSGTQLHILIMQSRFSGPAPTPAGATVGPVVSTPAPFPETPPDLLNLGQILRAVIQAPASTPPSSGAAATAATPPGGTPGALPTALLELTPGTVLQLRIVRVSTPSIPSVPGASPTGGPPGGAIPPAGAAAGASSETAGAAVQQAGAPLPGAAPLAGITATGPAQAPLPGTTAPHPGPAGPATPTGTPGPAAASSPAAIAGAAGAVSPAHPGAAATNAPLPATANRLTGVNPAGPPLSPSPSQAPLPGGAPGPTTAPAMPGLSTAPAAPGTASGIPGPATPSVGTQPNVGGLAPSGVPGTGQQGAPAPAADGAVRFPGQVSATTHAGHPVLTTPLGTMTLEIESALPVGTRLTLEIAAGAPSVGAPAPREGPGLGRPNPKAWPALEEAVEVLRAQAGPLQSGAPVPHEVPQPGPRLTSGMLFFLSALAAGDVGRWLGGQTLQTLRNAGRDGLIHRLNADLGQLSRMGEGVGGDWRLLPIPLWDGGQVRQLRLFLRQRDGRRMPGGQGKNAATRFILEVEMSRLGEMQLDGLVRARRFDLILRTRRALPANMRHDIQRIFQDVNEASGYSGGVGFQASRDWHFIPMKHAAAPSASGVVV